MRAYLTLHTQTLLSNFATLKNVVQKDIIAVVKSNAYGHGLAEIAKALSSHAKMFAVATLEEAMLLRKNFVFTPILLFSPTLDFRMAYQLKVTLSTSSLDYLKAIVASGYPFPIHLSIDTGMHRDGILEEELPFALQILEKSHLKLTGIYTHFTSREAYLEEYQIFLRCREKIHKGHLMVHTQATSTFDIPLKECNAVRIGLALYGYGTPLTKPILELYAPVQRVVPVHAGDVVGYHDTPIKKDGYIYTLGIGYADGWKRNGTYYAYIGNKLVKNYGIMCMDHTMFFSKTLVKNYEIELFGPHVPLEKVAKKNHTIACDITASLSPRLKRKFKK